MSAGPTPERVEALKREAAERALDDLVLSGMTLGLGSGSTARHVTLGVGARLRDGRLTGIVGVPTSEATAALARAQGIPLATLADCPHLDLDLDGADEIDPALNLVKGLGGALLRERIVAGASTRFCVVADGSKRVERLGERVAVPVEVVQFAAAVVAPRLRALGTEPALRAGADGSPFVTDEGNHIFDCRFGPIADAPALGRSIRDLPGVVDHGLFIGLASVAYVAGADGVVVLTPQP